MEDALEGRAFVDRPGNEVDDALIAEAAKRYPEAFGELYDRYYARVYRYSYHRLGNAADAEDVTGLVFMKALEALPSYRPGRNGFAPWLFRITRNAVVDHYRRRKPQCDLDEVQHESSVADPVRDVLAGERREELHGLIARLSPEQREVVLMRYAADLSFGEIAASLKKNEAAVRMLLHRGLRRMKAELDDEQP
ncbi:MAG: sigma-70 family RNA polymerase sigma factor [Chloroflexi bacterium]|nr:sigma-70 family RNA polymerase sigma factor [Chloroflexota bacterium]